MNLEVLVTTMHKPNTVDAAVSLYTGMNLSSDAIIANQTDVNSYHVFYHEGRRIKFICTDTRGLSKNRNIGLGVATAEYVLFADDDICFMDGYESMVQNELAACNNADSIKFYVETSSKSTRKIGWGRPLSRSIASRRALASAGTPALLVRRSFIYSKGMVFNEDFGAGTDDYCGEDTIFLQDLKKRGALVYASPACVAEVDQSNSSWFEGHNEKYFVTEGKVIGTIYPHLAPIIVVRSAYRQRKRHPGKFSFGTLYGFYLKGIREAWRNGR